MKKQIITISRQCGSGGHTIGEAVARQLDIPFYDKKLLEIVAKESGFPIDVVEQQGEHVPSNLLYSIATHISYGFDYIGRKNTYSLPDQIYAFQKKLIQELAKSESCVIVGRCADYILRNNAECLHVFIYGKIEDREKRVVSEHKIAGGDAKVHILDRDKKRRQHYEYYTGQKWGAVENYNLCLDSSYYGIDICTKIIADIQNR